MIEKVTTEIIGSFFFILLLVFLVLKSRIISAFCGLLFAASAIEIEYTAECGCIHCGLEDDVITRPRKRGVPVLYRALL